MIAKMLLMQVSLDYAHRVIKMRHCFSIPANPSVQQNWNRNMSHHDDHVKTPLDYEEMDANSRADAIAMFSLVVIIVTIAVFFASR